jgi:two-component system, NarL family, response regulator DevR
MEAETMASRRGKEQGHGSGTRLRSPRLRARLRTAARAWSLTPRQAQVLGLVTLGLGNKEIGEMLGCSPRTVELHLTAIYRKSGAERRTTLIALVWASPGVGRP